MKTKNILLPLLSVILSVLFSILAYSKFMCAEYILCGFYVLLSMSQVSLLLVYCKDSFKTVGRDLSWKETLFLVLFFMILIYSIIWLNDWLTPSICN